MEQYFRTVLVIEVLTAREAFNGGLEDLAAECIEGNASGEVKMRIVEHCSETEIAELLKDQGSDPEFLIEPKEDEEDLPAGYRWATADETEQLTRTGGLPGHIIVPRTADQSGVPCTQNEADVAVPVEPTQAP